MLRAARFACKFAWTFTAIVTLAASACGSSPPLDQNYGTDLGADFHPPVVDAASDAPGTGTAGAGGSSGVAGAGGAAGDTGGAAGDTGGAGGAAGDAGAGT
jgi:hypothetical protein